MFQEIKVQEWMTNRVISITPDAPISAAHQIMKEHDIRRLPVLDNGQLVGIVTIGDVREATPSDATTLSIWELNNLWAQVTVEKIMTRCLHTVKADNCIIDAAQTMLVYKVSGLPVIDDQGSVTGMITESDIFRMVVEIGAKEANVLHS
jgi:CBS domain-containing protein